MNNLREGLLYGPNVRVRVEPSRFADTISLIFRIAGRPVEQTIIGRERIVNHAVEVTRRLKTMGAEQHPAVIQANKYIADHNNILEVLSNEADSKWKELVQDFETQFLSHLSLHVGNYDEEVQTFLEILSQGLQQFGGSRELDEYFGESTDYTEIRLVPSYYYEPLGGTSWHNAQGVFAYLFFWVPYTGDQALSPMGVEWLHQGILHFLTLCKIKKHEGSIDVSPLTNAINEAAILDKKISDSWIWRNVFLAARARVFERYCNSDYAHSLVRFYTSQGNCLVNWLYDHLPATNNEMRYISQLTRSLSSAPDMLIQQITDERNKPFRGPLGACFARFFDSPLVACHEDNTELKSFVSAVWRTSRVPVTTYITRPSDIWQSKNVMLYCTGTSDVFVGDLLKSKDIVVRSDSICVGGRELRGEHLRYRVVMQNPYQPKSWICIFGGEKIETLRKYRKTLYLDLFFDYVVMEGDDALEAGFFDETSQEVIYAPEQVLRRLGLKDK